MLFIGKYNYLEINRVTSVGLFLRDVEGDEVLLPNKYCTDDMQLEDTVKVFVYNDSEDRPVATTLTPKLIRNEYGYLEVKDVSSNGAYLDWGLEKDLFVPFREQLEPMRVGEKYIVYLYLDRMTDRLLASAKWKKYLDNERLIVAEGDEVDLLVAERTDLGYNVIVNNFHKGLVYANEIFKPVNVGDRLKGYVKQIREENKLDISLQKIGYANVEDHSKELLEVLKANNGYLDLNDSSSPDVIQKRLKMSKKTFKKAVGGLFKQGLITLEEEGIRLVVKD